MEQEPNASSYSEIANKVDDTETLVSVSFKRLLSQATDWAMDRGGLDYINGKNDRATDIYERLESGTVNSISKIEFMASANRNSPYEPDSTNFYIGVTVLEEVDYQDLPTNLIRTPNQINSDNDDDGENSSETVIEDIDEDAECIKEINIYINFDTKSFFSSATYVSYEIDGYHYQTINRDEENSGNSSSQNDDIDDNLSKTILNLEQDIAIDQMEQASRYLSMLMDRSFGGIQ